MMKTLPGLDDIEAAARRIDGVARCTPLLESPALNERSGGRVLLKAEVLQRTGTFKFRGAFNAISKLDRQSWPGGVVAFSSGNHAQGVAAAANICGLAATIVMPADAPTAKREPVKALGAAIVDYDRERDDRAAMGAALAREKQAALIPPYDDARIIAGQGTAGLEIARQAATLGLEPDVLLAPCSGGGLVAGCALAMTVLNPAMAVYAVEPAGFDDTGRSLASGRREENSRLSGSICDALLAPQPGELTFAINRDRLRGGLVVDDDQVRAAMRFAFRELKLVLEPGGAAALAAVLARKLATQDRTIAVILSGGNVDADLFAAAIRD
jgi:threonine dehydratase